MDNGHANEVAVHTPLDALTIEKVLVGGDLAELSPEQRVQYYQRVCSSLGLNPLTKPFEYIRLNNKLTLYAKRDTTDQLRKLHHIDVLDMTEETRGDMYIITTKVRDKDGRIDIAKGVVSLKGLAGEALANQMMKGETKSKRRATLSICGLGWLDETEVETIPTAERVTETDAPLVVKRDPRQLFIALRKHGIKEDAFRAYLATRFEKESTKDLTPDEFDTLLVEIEDGTVKQFLAMPEGAGE